jgi:hypothetical protein
MPVFRAELQLHPDRHPLGALATPALALVLNEVLKRADSRAGLGLKLWPAGRDYESKGSAKGRGTVHAQTAPCVRCAWQQCC